VCTSTQIAHALACARTCTHTHIIAHAHHRRTHSCAYDSMRTSIQAHTHTNTYTHSHIHIRTHKPDAGVAVSGRADQARTSSRFWLRCDSFLPVWAVPADAGSPEQLHGATAVKVGSMTLRVYLLQRLLHHIACDSHKATACKLCNMQ